jgi:hypothetical protein
MLATREVTTMSGPSIQFHKIWIEQCEATEGIRDFVQASELHPEFASELPAFVAEIRRVFAAREISEYLVHMERTKFLAPPDPELEGDELDAEIHEEHWSDNPVRGAEELLRFCRIRQLLQQ